MTTYANAGTPVNNEYYLIGPPTAREHWRSEAERLGSDWDGVMSLALNIVATTMFETEFERAGRRLDRARRPAPKPAPRATPKATIEAVMWSVRERGVSALREPSNRQRLVTFDAEARKQLNERIARLGARQAHAA